MSTPITPGESFRLCSDDYNPDWFLCLLTRTSTAITMNSPNSSSLTGWNNEENIRLAFQNCLVAYCADRSEQLVLVPELRFDSSNKPHGTTRESLRMTPGLWEAKDAHDDLDHEIQSKFNRGYPRDYIVFESLEAGGAVPEPH